MVKKNNFDFLRFIFAILVVIAHSYPLSGDSIKSQWIYQITIGQIELSNIGLNGFFVLSGYLIFQSFERSENIFAYYWKRFLRLFPALFIVLLVTIILMPLVYDNALPYLKNKDVYTYLPNNMSLYNLQYGIKGIFENNPHPFAINGSLWTICYEFSLYVLLSGLFLFRKIKPLVKVFVFFSFVIMFVGYNFFIEKLGGFFLFGMQGLYFLNLGTFFVCGSLLASLRIEQMEYKRIVFFVALLILFVSLYFNFYNLIKHIILTIIILFIGLKPLPFFSSFGKIGDMSYGVYIYSFPIQQTLMYFFNLNTESLLISSIVLSIIFGYLSWHLIEKKALSYKNWNIFSVKSKKDIAVVNILK